ncbi:aldo/keto reductase [Salinibacter ruber]|jgi:diketogulonate reductase-like aldo/keto reductase|uniref:Diketogulonate reductase-like aldo/keto reductase n=1 Tax=Salinibacter ruber TaxID=146919 RepID=A0A9X2TF07_9BACT|nr:aldo/keto reductase [Salinibacter ruber]MCS3659949.1 diketogulonate reductase-like aldo/keto reductase [Salinibacter ruber]MCS3709990.1 diketogulonate reductase-like aldo/keto reductase [Salinibacter ruber]MCS4170184.1 diketogulonate reductase-like aldo/keto reductase [Salinibacter ruber]
MPALGLGVFQSSPDETVKAVRTALDEGYRLVDTAAAYQNEEQVGEGLRRSDVDRSEVFVTTKLWISDYGYDEALHAYDRSLDRLGLDTVDLYLLHQPMPRQFERTVATWEAAEQLLDDGRVRAIGVSNFSAELLDVLVGRTDVVPAVNQVEVHPYFTQESLRNRHEQLGIVTQAWSPIGGVMRYWDDDPEASMDPLRDPAIVEIAEKYEKTAAQVMLRWHLEHGHSAIPKSVHEGRIVENFDVFDFSLTEEEVAAIDDLDTGTRGGPDPEKIDTDTYG